MHTQLRMECHELKSKINQYVIPEVEKKKCCQRNSYKVALRHNFKEHVVDCERLKQYLLQSQVSLQLKSKHTGQMAKQGARASDESWITQGCC